jgi:PilZ domain
MKDANRTRTRVKYSAHALAKTKDREPLKGTVRDIALDTIYLYIVPAFAVDEEVSLEIVLLGADSQLSIKVKANVIRKDHDGIALRFTRSLEWWPIFTFFPLHSLDDDSTPDGMTLAELRPNRA